MELKDIIFEPHSDMSADDAELLNSNYYEKGFRASLFNSIQNKIRKLEEFLLNEFAAEKDEYYSYEEPDAKQMDGKSFWIQILP